MSERKSGDGPPLDRILRCLVEELARIGDGRASDPSPGPASWADDSHVYLEIDLPGPSSIEADLTIHQGKIFIRLES